MYFSSITAIKIEIEFYKHRSIDGIKTQDPLKIQFPGGGGLEFYFTCKIKITLPNI